MDSSIIGLLYVTLELNKGNKFINGPTVHDLRHKTRSSDSVKGFLFVVTFSCLWLRTFYSKTNVFLNSTSLLFDSILACLEYTDMCPFLFKKNTNDYNNETKNS